MGILLLPRLLISMFLGEAMFLNAKGAASCQCKDGWGRNSREGNTNQITWGQDDTKATVKSGGRCFQEFTKAFCKGNRLCKFMEKDIFGCMNNPCGNSTLSIPHL